MSLEKNKKIIIKEDIIDIFLLLLGCAIMAFATSFFLLPNQLSSGGFTGIATIAYYKFSLPVGQVLLALNLPLYVLSYIKIGKKFVLKSLLGTFFLSSFIDLFNNYFKGFTSDRILACVYGGIIIGIGSALVLKGFGSTGGSDLLAYLIKLYIKHLRTSNIIIGIDIVIILLNVIFFKDLEIGLYSAITIYAMGKMIDIVFEGIYFTKMIFIISDKYDEISNQIKEKIKRGITGFYGKGMYTDNKKMILMCLSNRNETMKIKQICKNIDKNSFLVIVNAREVYGMGFKAHKD